MGHARLLLAAICLAGCATESVPPPRATAPPVPAPAERAPDAEPAAAPAATATPAPPTQEMTQAPPRPPAQVENGRWRVSALSLRTAEEAGRWAARLQGEGYRV
jgi:cell division septation protein DedD